MKKNIKTDFQVFEENLSDNERASLHKYMADLRQHIALNSLEKRDMLADFEKAILYYSTQGIPLSEALELLSARNLGGFYARPSMRWYPLDNAAKIYPLAMKRGQMSVFRLSVYLKSPVIPVLLQIALAFTIKRFPSFATTVKSGFFWHYLDSTKRRFIVQPEKSFPCRPIKISTSGSQSFRVLYFDNRISIEFFHVLTDGTGGMLFLKTLTAEYLRLEGVHIPSSSDYYDINSAPQKEEVSNDFLKVKLRKSENSFADNMAVQMSGPISTIKPCQILHFELDTGELKNVVKSRDTTVTALILAMMFIAGKDATDVNRGSIHIQVPVNMRKFYESKTVRNFTMFCNIKLPLSEIRGIDDILPEIKKQLNEKAAKGPMEELMISAVKLVRSLKFVPLFIKRPVAALVYGFLGDRVFSNTLSNLGVVHLPEELSAYVEKFDFVLGTAITNRATCSMVTYKDKAVLSVTKLTSDPSFEERLYSLMTENGLTPVMRGSVLYGN